MIILLILLTISLDCVLILLGESWCWSLLGLKALISPPTPPPLHQIPATQATKLSAMQTNDIYLIVQKYHVFTYIYFTQHPINVFIILLQNVLCLCTEIKICTNTILCIPKTRLTHKIHNNLWHNLQKSRQNNFSVIQFSWTVSF